VGKAILHIHTTYSDGLATVEQILHEVEHHSDVDVVGFTDHDDVRAFRRALRWKAEHPKSRVQPLWGLELTVWGFKHLLVYTFRAPFPKDPFPKFLPLHKAVRLAKAAGGVVIVPHVDVFWVGMGRHRLARVAKSLGIDGLELLTPFQGSDRSVGNLLRMNKGHGLLAIGGSDAHHLEDLYRVLVEFPGHTVGDLERAFRERTALPRWGPATRRVPIHRQVRQHTRALVMHPCKQLHGWARRRIPASPGRESQLVHPPGGRT
jgi:predicted metal-dependent phosphoesterase TrpH